MLYERRDTLAGFTLVEMAMVLVVIGLVVGGVLVGQSLVEAARLHSVVTQIQQYRTATHTFLGKYDYLPGDIPNPRAVAYGFLARGSYAGQGDGDGYISGVSGNGPNLLAQQGNKGEGVMFWRDLSAVGMIKGLFDQASPTTAPMAITGSAVGQYIPEAKIGGGNYIYIWTSALTGGQWVAGNGNFFALSKVTTLMSGATYTNTGLSPGQAYSLDNKLDDGYPQSGKVTAQFLNIMCCLKTVLWASGVPNDNLAAASTGWPTYSPVKTATPGSDTTCYDNNNTGGRAQEYSVGDTDNLNCALSFRF